MDASTAAGTVGAGFGVFLLVLLVVGASSGFIVGGMIGRLLHVPESVSFVLSVACAPGLVWFFTRRNKPKT